MICALFCCYFGCASWYVPFLVLISTAPHDICPFWFSFRLRFMICAPFLFLFRLRLMICALFVSYFSCTSWYVPFFCSYFGCTSWYVPLSCSYFGCASWYVPFLLLISAAPHALFASYFSCASWYVPFFCSYFGCASWYVPFFVLISAAPNNMRLFFVLITSQRHLWSIVTDARQHGMYVHHRLKLIIGLHSFLCRERCG